MGNDIYDNKIIFFRYEKTGKQKVRHRKRKGETIKEYVDEVEKFYYSERDVMDFSLEDVGTPIPYRPGNKTIIENYLIQYWQYFLGFEATMTYINYLSMCISNHMPFISLDHMAENMGVSTPTLGKYLDKLEEHGFVMRFWATSRENKGLNTSTRVKVRQTIPLLSEAQIAELPDRLLDNHNEFMMKLMESYDVKLEGENDSTEVNEFLKSRGRKREPSKPVVVSSPAISLEKKKHQVMDMRTEQDIVIWDSMLPQISDKLNKTEFNTWFSKSFCLIREEGVFILVENDFCKEWIKSRYMGIITNAWLNSTGAAASQFIVETVEEHMI